MGLDGVSSYMGASQQARSGWKCSRRHWDGSKIKTAENDEEGRSAWAMVNSHCIQAKPVWALALPDRR